jgi:hypothetical protein
VAVRVAESAENGRHAGFAGLSSCGSPWACPVCSAKVAAYRQSEIERALRAWGDRGGKIALATFTMRHRAGQSLSELWDALSYAWGKVTSGRAWVADQQSYGVPMVRIVRSGSRKGQPVVENRIRIIRVVEVTHGDNGWHVHIHALLLLDQAADADQAGYIADAMFGRWSRALVRSGFDSPSRRRGVDMRMLDSGDPAKALGEYFTKSVYESAAAEVARGDMKDAKGGNQTPFGVLRSLVTTGVEGETVLTDAQRKRALAIWYEFEAASRGRRQVSWTVGLRGELLGNEEEVSDQEIAEQEIQGDTVEPVDRDTWTEVHRARADYAVLAAFRRSLDEGRALLEVFRGRAGMRGETYKPVGVDRLRMHRTGDGLRWGASGKFSRQGRAGLGVEPENFLPVTHSAL